VYAKRRAKRKKEKEDKKRFLPFLAFEYPFRSGK
jgi:hypothetical protein